MRRKRQEVEYISAAAARVIAPLPAVLLLGVTTWPYFESQLGTLPLFFRKPQKITFLFSSSSDEPLKGAEEEARR